MDIFRCRALGDPQDYGWLSGLCVCSSFSARHSVMLYLGMSLALGVLCAVSV